MQSRIPCAMLAAVLVGTSLFDTQATPASHSDGEAKEVAVTFDDLPLNGPSLEIDRMLAMTEKLLAETKRSGATVVGFVNESKLYKLGEIDRRVGLLRMWLDAGAELGNHTFSHPSLNEATVELFKEEIIRGETIIRMLLSGRGGKLRYFRHPYLRTGLSIETRGAVEGFLKERGYTIAPVTIENSDWMFNSVYTKAKTSGDERLMKRIGEAYVDYTSTMFEFFEQTTKKLFGRQIRHVLLLHANEINADHLDRVIRVMKDRGYEFVTLERALTDEAYELPDRYTGRAGVTWLFRWDYSGGRRIDWRSEPEPPAFVREMYSNR